MVENPPAYSRQRVHRRAFVEVPVVLIATQMGTTNIFGGRTLDVSEGGMSILTAGFFHPNQPVSIEMKAPQDNLMVKLHAEVRHAEENRYGLKFVAPSEEQRLMLRKMMN
ncbi:MAG: PilZ domain-containing protein [Acidobacteriales bacterium]|nr:PilZ domain-containing protein [Terriglobales bacterium]